MKNKQTYQVGYGKPPKNTQFKPGQSGNQKGRPKDSSRFLNLGKLLNIELNENITTNDGQSIKKRRVLAKQLVNKAIKGDVPCAKFVAQEIHKTESKDVLLRFAHKLLEENYITKDQMKRFVYGNSILESNKTPEEINYIWRTTAIKQNQANIAAYDLLKINYLFFCYIQIIVWDIIVQEIIEEISFWDGVETTLEYLPKTQRNKILNELAGTRSHPRPDEGMLQAALEIESISKTRLWAFFKVFANRFKTVSGVEEKLEYILREAKKALESDAKGKIELSQKEKSEYNLLNECEEARIITQAIEPPSLDFEVTNPKDAYRVMLWTLKKEDYNEQNFKETIDSLTETAIKNRQEQENNSRDVKQNFSIGD